MPPSPCTKTRDISSSLSSLFRSPVQIREAPVRLADAELHAEEFACICNAAHKRRAEFATGRILAREALMAIGVPAGALVSNANREPVWPCGVVGSISHSEDYCFVAVARMPPLYSIGVDVENIRSLDLSTSKLILTSGEESWLRKQPSAMRDGLTVLIFSAKEAFYKCQYTITNSFLDFHEVELTPDLAQGSFEAQVRKDWPARVARLPGRFVFRENKVFCAVELL